MLFGIKCSDVSANIAVMVGIMTLGGVLAVIVYRSH
jgi:hypothetical protein